MPSHKSKGITAVAFLMIVFGLAEIATGFTHNFLGQISITDSSIATYLGVGIGGLYFLAGLFVLTMRRWAATLALICLALVIAGRISFVAAGLFLLNSFEQTFAIVVGTSIAAIFALYIGFKWRSFN